MLVITTFSHLMAHISEVKASTSGDTIYTYYSDSDTMPVNAYKTLTELGDRIKLTPFSDLGNRPENLLLAAMARVVRAGEPQVAVVGKYDPAVHELSIDGAKYAVRVTNTFTFEPGQKPVTAGQVSAPPVNARPNPVSEKKFGGSVQHPASDGYPRLSEFMTAIPTSAVPRAISKEDFAKHLYNAISHAACDSDILQVLEASIGPNAANAIEILNANGAMPALKDIVRGN